MPENNENAQVQAPAGGAASGGWQRLVSKFKARCLRWALRGCDDEFIRQLYRGVLQRKPDPEGLAAYTKEMRATGNLAVILKSLVDSQEHQQKMFALRAPAMVKAAYAGVLGREPDPEGERAHSEFLASTQDLTALLSNMTDSPEFRIKQFARVAPDLVKAAYQGVLEREADPEELAEGLAGLAKDQSLEPLLKRLVNLEEFQRKVLAARMPKLVRGAYTGLLGREPDPEGEKAHSAFLAGTLDFAAFFAGIHDSAEFKQRQLTWLGSDAAPGAHPSPLGANGRQVAECPECQADFNEEFLDRTTTARTVRAAFCFILGRTASPADVRSHLLANSTARQLRFTLMDSHEFRQRMTRLFPTKRPTTAEIDAVKTIFVHIPKTGGTTMHELLKPLFEHQRACPERYDGLHCYRAGELTSFQLFSGHFSLAACDLIPGPKRIFTMLRKPIDRLLSHYNFAKAHVEQLMVRDPLWKLVRQYSMRDFFSLEQVRIDPSVNNTMVRLMARLGALESDEAKAMIASDLTGMNLLDAAKKNLRALLTFGIMERYEESVSVIFHALGLHAPERIQPRNVLKDIAGKAAGIELLEAQTPGPEEMAAISPLIGADVLLYEYGLQLFEQNIKALPKNKN